jgi:hypothetical protein
LALTLTFPIPDIVLGLPFDLSELKAEFEACFAVLPTFASDSEHSEERCGLRVKDAMCALEKAVSQVRRHLFEFLNYLSLCRCEVVFS